MDLTTERIEQFLVPRRAAKGNRACSFQGLLALLEVLIEEGVLPETSTPPVGSAAQETLARFQSYLLAERGLAACTAGAYVERARRFLEGFGVERELADLSAGDVTRAVQREAARVSIGSTQYFVAAVRALLRFCVVEGLAGTDLSAAALAVTGRRRSSLPKGISGTDAVALLGSCDRRRPGGRRDYAAVGCLRSSGAPAPGRCRASQGAPPLPHSGLFAGGGRRRACRDRRGPAAPGHHLHGDLRPGGPRGATEPGAALARG